MSGGISWLTLPAGYLGSSLIGAALITCGFDTNASKVASLALAVFFVFTLWWARRNVLCVFFLPPAAHVSAELMIKAVGRVFTRTWVLLLGMSGLILLFWFLKGGEVLRFLVSFFLGKQEEVLL
jgi:Peptidase M50B-like